jgi:hypothetical protein
MTINRLNQGVTNQVLVKAVSGQTTPLLELQDSTGAVVSSIGPSLLEAEMQAKQAKLESAKAKLAALGLDEEEVAAIVGGI